jgi:hypothetical protein
MVREIDATWNLIYDSTLRMYQKLVGMPGFAELIAGKIQ